MSYQLGGSSSSSGTGRVHPSDAGRRLLDKIVAISGICGSKVSTCINETKKEINTLNETEGPWSKFERLLEEEKKAAEEQKKKQVDDSEREKKELDAAKKRDEEFRKEVEKTRLAKEEEERLKKNKVVVENEADDALADVVKVRNLHPLERFIERILAGNFSNLEAQQAFFFTHLEYILKAAGSTSKVMMCESNSLNPKNLSYEQLMDAQYQAILARQLGGFEEQTEGKSVDGEKAVLDLDHPSNVVDGNPEERGDYKVYFSYQFCPNREAFVKLTDYLNGWVTAMKEDIRVYAFIMDILRVRLTNIRSPEVSKDPDLAFQYPLLAVQDGSIGLGGKDTHNFTGKQSGQAQEHPPTTADSTADSLFQDRAGLLDELKTAESLFNQAESHKTNAVTPVVMRAIQTLPNWTHVYTESDLDANRRRLVMEIDSLQVAEEFRVVEWISARPILQQIIGKISQTSLLKAKQAVSRAETKDTEYTVATTKSLDEALFWLAASGKKLQTINAMVKSKLFANEKPVIRLFELLIELLALAKKYPTLKSAAMKAECKRREEYRLEMVQQIRRESTIQVTAAQTGPVSTPHTGTLPPHQTRAVPTEQTALVGSPQTGSVGSTQTGLLPTGSPETDSFHTVTPLQVAPVREISPIEKAVAKSTTVPGVSGIVGRQSSRTSHGAPERASAANTTPRQSATGQSVSPRVSGVKLSPRQSGTKSTVSPRQSGANQSLNGGIQSHPTRSQVSNATSSRFSRQASNPIPSSRQPTPGKRRSVRNSSPCAKVLSQSKRFSRTQSANTNSLKKTSSVGGSSSAGNKNIAISDATTTGTASPNVTTTTVTTNSTTTEVTTTDVNTASKENTATASEETGVSRNTTGPSTTTATSTNQQETITSTNQEETSSPTNQKNTGGSPTNKDSTSPTGAATGETGASSLTAADSDQDRSSTGVSNNRSSRKKGSKDAPSMTKSSSSKDTPTVAKNTAANDTVANTQSNDTGAEKTKSKEAVLNTFQKDPVVNDEIPIIPEIDTAILAKLPENIACSELKGELLERHIQLEKNLFRLLSLGRNYLALCWTIISEEEYLKEDGLKDLVVSETSPDSSFRSAMNDILTRRLNARRLFPGPKSPASTDAKHANLLTGGVGSLIGIQGGSSGSIMDSIIINNTDAAFTTGEVLSRLLSKGLYGSESILNTAEL